ILLYVINEFSYESSHKNRDNIYRVLSYSTEDSGDEKMAINSSLLVPTIKNDVPEIIAATRLNKLEGRPFFIKSENEFIRETSSIYKVDEDFFKIFTFPIVYGNPDKLFNDPSSIVITEEISSKYFGEKNPIGDILEILEYDDIKAYTVSGVIKNSPDNTIIKPDFIVNIDPTIPAFARAWGPRGFECFVLTRSDIEKSIIEEKLKQIPKNHHPEQKWTYCLQNLGDIYLNSGSIIYGTSEHGNIKTILMFSGIAVLILIIACLNYIILSTTQSVTRSKEIGIRKVLGAYRKNLIRQILMESVLISIISLPLALVIAERMRPVVSELFGKDLPIAYSHNWQYLIGFICITIIVGIISGAYLSLHLSRLNPIHMLNKSANRGRKRSVLQKVLITIQLVIFITLMVCTSIINRQVHFSTNTYLGYNKDKLIDLKCNDKGLLKNYKIFKEELEKYPEILKVTGARTGLLSDQRIANTVQAFKESEKEISMFYIIADFDYFEALDLEVAEGLGFIGDNSKESDKILLNETAVKELGYDDPIGKTVFTNSKNYEIAGIVKNFNMESLHNEVPPIIFFKNSEGNQLNQILVRTKNDINPEIIKTIKETWNKLSDGIPMESTLMKDKIQTLYKSEVNLGKTINLFTILTIFISALGLFGLSLYLSRQKTKEIGIRKVNGAGIKNIITLIIKEFLWVILIANIIAIPISIFIMNKWLENFAYKTNIGFMVFVSAALLSGVIV
ncbi:ABC transporter permease, partial [Bacteroidota bacterium]